MRNRRAYVYFHDGFRFGPRINTHGENLEERLCIAIGTSRQQTPEHVSAAFIAMGVMNDEFCIVENAPPGRTFGDYFANALNEANWPTRDFDGRAYNTRGGDLPAGVFLVHTVTFEVTAIGGFGFREEDVNWRQERTINLLPEEGPDGEG